jgi:hypothetical protein
VERRYETRVFVQGWQAWTDTDTDAVLPVDVELGVPAEPNPHGPLTVITVRAATAPDALHLAQVIADAVKPLAAARREQQQ